MQEEPRGFELNDPFGERVNKIDNPVDKRKWHPSLIPGSVVLISTYNSKKEPNIAPKSWTQVASIEPPFLGSSAARRELPRET